MGINIRGNLFCIQAPPQSMIIKSHGGRIVPTASTAACKPDKRASAYCTSKSAIPMLTNAAVLNPRAMACERPVSRDFQIALTVP